MLRPSEFTVLRYATDAVVGEPTKYRAILRKARTFSKSKPFHDAILVLEEHLGELKDTSNQPALVKLADELAPRTARLKTTARYFAGTALRASIESRRSKPLAEVG